MPMRRRYAPKRRLVRRKRLARRPFKPIRRQPRGQPSVYSFKRTIFNKDNIVISGTDFAAAWSWDMNALPNVTDFSNLYDMYMIKKIVVKIIPKYSEALLNSGASTNANMQQIHSVIDYDDGTNPTSINDLVQYQSHKLTRGNQVHTRVFVPKVELATSAANAPKAYQWIDFDSLTTTHRGMKVYIPAPTSASTQVVYDVQTIYYFSCKNVV